MRYKHIFKIFFTQGLALKFFDLNYRFHPAIHRVKQVLESKELGAIKNISVTMLLPGTLFKDDDIRYNYALGGGALMDLGCGGLLFFQRRYMKLTFENTRLCHELHSISIFLDRGFSGFCYS